MSLKVALATTSVGLSSTSASAFPHFVILRTQRRKAAISSAGMTRFGAAMRSDGQSKERWFSNHRPSNRGGAAKSRGPDFQQFTKHVFSSGAGTDGRSRRTNIRGLSRGASRSSRKRVARLVDTPNLMRSYCLRRVAAIHASVCYGAHLRSAPEPADVGGPSTPPMLPRSAQDDRRLGYDDARHLAPSL